MTPYVLVSRSTDYENRLRKLLGAQLNVITGEFLTFGADSVLEMVGGVTRIALLGPVLSFEETRDLARGLLERFPDIGLIIVREQRADLEDWVDELPIHAVLNPLASDEVTLELLDRLAAWLVSNDRAQASDFEDPTGSFHESESPIVGESATALDEDDLVRVPDEVMPDEATEVTGEASASTEEWLFPPLEPGARSEAIAVVAPKGGQGKSTIAINLAVGLARAAPNSVVLVDGDLQFGDVSVALALQPTHTIVDAVALEAVDELVLKTTLTHHAAGFFVVASAPSPELGDGVQPDALAQLISRLRAMFRYVVVDTTPGLGEHTLSVLENVTDAVFVTNMSVASLRALRAELSLLSTLGMLPANRHTVLNFSDRSAGLTSKDAAAIIGTPIDVEIPRSSAVVLAANRGRPLIYDRPRDPAVKAIEALLARIAGQDLHKPTRTARRRRILEPQ